MKRKHWISKLPLLTLSKSSHPLVARIPMLLLIGMWILSIWMVSIALLVLFDPGSTFIVTPNSGRLPYWLFGASAFGCAVGSILLSRCLHRKKI